eukprot:Clim_evm40s198 gene=Clim_evmTU40s198
MLRAWISKILFNSGAPIDGQNSESATLERRKSILARVQVLVRVQWIIALLLYAAGFGILANYIVNAAQAAGKAYLSENALVPDNPLSTVKANEALYCAKITEEMFPMFRSGDLEGILPAVENHLLPLGFKRLTGGSQSETTVQRATSAYVFSPKRSLGTEIVLWSTTISLDTDGVPTDGEAAFYTEASSLDSALSLGATVGLIKHLAEQKYLARSLVLLIIFPDLIPTENEKSSSAPNPFLPASVALAGRWAKSVIAQGGIPGEFQASYHFGLTAATEPRYGEADVLVQHRQLQVVESGCGDEERQIVDGGRVPSYPKPTADAKVALMELGTENANGQVSNLDLFNAMRLIIKRKTDLKVRPAAGNNVVLSSLIHLLRAGALPLQEHLMYAPGKLGKDRPLSPTEQTLRMRVFQRLNSILQSLSAQAMGVPLRAHGVFGGYGMPSMDLHATRISNPGESLILEDSKTRKRRVSVSRASRAMLEPLKAAELQFRATNNLLERVHQSFFLYFLVDADFFIDNERYQIAIFLMVGALLVIAVSSLLFGMLSALIQSTEEQQRQSPSSGYRGKRTKAEVKDQKELPVQAYLSTMEAWSLARILFRGCYLPIVSVIWSVIVMLLELNSTWVFANGALGATISLAVLSTMEYDVVSVAQWHIERGITVLWAAMILLPLFYFNFALSLVLLITAGLPLAVLISSPLEPLKFGTESPMSLGRRIRTFTQAVIFTVWASPLTPLVLLAVTHPHAFGLPSLSTSPSACNDLRNPMILASLLAERDLTTLPAEAWSPVEALGAHARMATTSPYATALGLGTEALRDDASGLLVMLDAMLWALVETSPNIGVDDNEGTNDMAVYTLPFVLLVHVPVWMMGVRLAIGNIGPRVPLTRQA